MPAARIPRVLMLGPAPKTHGGIASVVALYQEHWQADQATLSYIPTFCTGSRRQKFTLVFKAVLHYLVCLLRGQTDVVHLHASWRMSFYRKSIFAVIAMVLGYPYLLHIHNSLTLFQTFYDRQWRPGQWLIRTIFHHAAGVIVLDPQWKAFFQQHNIAVQRMVILPNPAPPIRAPHTSRLSNMVTVVMPGGYKIEKGIRENLCAIESLLPQCQDVEVWFYGDEESPLYRQQAQALGTRVHALGWLDKMERNALLQQADILLHASYAEGMPMVVLEGMAYGLAVIATPVGGTAEILQHGETAWCIQPRDSDQILEALLTLIRSPLERHRLGENARSQSEAYHPTVVLQELYSFYAQVALCLPFDGTRRD